MTFFRWTSVVTETTRYWSWTGPFPHLSQAHLDPVPTIVTHAIRIHRQVDLTIWLPIPLATKYFTGKVNRKTSIKKRTDVLASAAHILKKKKKEENRWTNEAETWEYSSKSGKFLFLPLRVLCLEESLEKIRRETPAFRWRTWDKEELR